MTSTQQKGVSSDRLQSPPPINVELLECSVCRDILWKPIACQLCETPFCSACISRCHVNNPTKCPNRCAAYTERKCPPFIVSLLAKLQIACFYQSNGCEHILSYEALDKHEIECGFQIKQCPGCKTEILKKDFNIHENNCQLFPLTCKDCKLVYIRNETAIKHTENICLREQIKQLQYESNESKREMQKLTRQLTEIHKLNSLLTREIITFDDLPSAVLKISKVPSSYKGLKWTNFSYLHELFVIKNYPRSGYVTSFMPGGSLHVAYFAQQATINNERPNETFTLVSLTACAAWNDDMQLTITAYHNSTEVKCCNIILLFGRPQCILLEWKNIDKITFKASGGTPHIEKTELTGCYVALTQITLDDLAGKQIMS